MKIYVGNLAYNVADEDLQRAFESFGTVVSATVIKDKFSGQSKGFGFVEMSAKAEAQAAINKLNGQELNGRSITVNEARPPRENYSSGGGRRGGGRF